MIARLHHTPAHIMKNWLIFKYFDILTKNIKKQERQVIMKNEVWTATSTLIATTIGAGILGMPYVFSKSGFLIGALYIIFFSSITLIFNLFTAEAVLRTKQQHHLAGLARNYI